METLQQKLLDAARDEVARENGYDNWQEVEESIWTAQRDSLRDESTELAMEKQASFWKWCIREELTLGVGQHEGQDVYCFPEGAVYTEHELYEIWEGQK